MRSAGFTFVILALIFVFITRSPIRVAPALSAGQSVGASQIQAPTPEAYGKLPLYFIENSGQVDRRVAYYIQGSDKTIYFTAEGLTFNLTKIEDRGLKIEDGSAQFAILDSRFSILDPQSAIRNPQSVERWTLKLDFVGANPGVRPRGLDPTEAVFSYFKGSREQWRTGLKTYSSIVYPDLWPGIDLIYAGTANRMKYSFVVKPGADPGQIKLAYRGADEVKINRAGQLEVSAPIGGFLDESPVSYQEVGGRQVEIATAYQLGVNEKRGATVYGFQIGEYDRSRELVIDPAVLVYCGFLGGAGSDQGRGIAVDNSGNAYVTGFTDSTEASFPVTAGPDLSYNGANFDAFVAKIKADGTGLVYCGYIGGGSNDGADSIAVDGAGNAYVIGGASSTQATFPVVGGPDLSYNGGSVDAFVAKVNAAGTALVYCGYIGGGGIDLGHGIAVDGAGSVYITGETTSTQSSFPVTGGPDLTFNGGAVVGDVFVAKINEMGSALVYCGYIGGSGEERGQRIAVDGAGAAYITGFTNSTESSFPVAVGPDLTFNGNTGDAFVAKVNAAGTALVYCGYIGGSGVDDGGDIAVDRLGAAYVVGTTGSTETSFPVAGGPDLSYNGEISDAFVAKVNASGSALVYCGYIGGNSFERGLGIAIDGLGQAYVTGETRSTEASFPVVGGPDLAHNGAGFIDAFVAKVSVAGTGLIYCGYIGGSNGDSGLDIAADSLGNAYVVGVTFSTEANFPVLGGPDLSYNGGNLDVFIAKISDGVNNATSVSAASFSGPTLASESIVGAFGAALATTTTAAASVPLPTELAGTRVLVRDSAGMERQASLFFVSPNQVNYQIPPETASGSAAVTIVSGDGRVSVGAIRVVSIAPGLFAANANGQGVAAAVALRVKADGSRSFEPVARFDAAQNRFVAIPIDLGPDTDQVFLLLFGTGIKFRGALSAVSVRIGGADAPVSFAGAQGDFVGLDQVNALLPRSLAGRGEVEISLMVDGLPANFVRASIR
jgi:uncharacterized protein (TIGR03437 family)